MVANTDERAWPCHTEDSPSCAILGAGGWGAGCQRSWLWPWVTVGGVSRPPSVFFKSEQDTLMCIPQVAPVIQRGRGHSPWKQWCCWGAMALERRTDKASEPHCQVSPSAPRESRPSRPGSADRRMIGKHLLPIRGFYILQNLILTAVLWGEFDHALNSIFPLQFIIEILECIYMKRYTE